MQSEISESHLNNINNSSAQQRLHQEKVRALIPQMLRVNHAGELGAVQIYRGQLLALRKASDSGKIINDMLDHELEHLKIFNDLLVQKQVRPSILTPLWRIAGFGLGVVSGMISAQAAMACTVAIEDAIDEHYSEQADLLKGVDEELLTVINQCHKDELAHRDLGLAEGAAEAYGYGVMHTIIKTGAKAAIWLAKHF